MGSWWKTSSLVMDSTWGEQCQCGHRHSSNTGENLFSHENFVLLDMCAGDIRKRNTWWKTKAERAVKFSMP